jgi:hypothetical protein
MGNPSRTTIPVEHTGVAMLAAAQHFIDHRLPAPHSISAPVCRHDREISIGVPAVDLQTWLNSITVIDATSRPARSEGWETVGFYGTLPDSGVRVVVKCARKTGSGDCHGGCIAGSGDGYLAPDCALHGPASSKARGFTGPDRRLSVVNGGGA